MRQQLNVRTFSPHCSLSSSMLHAWALRKGWTCHCNSFEVFKNFIFQLMSSDPDPVEEDLLYMIKTLFFFFQLTVFSSMFIVFQALTLSLTLASWYAVESGSSLQDDSVWTATIQHGFHAEQSIVLLVL